MKHNDKARHLRNSRYKGRVQEIMEKQKALESQGFEQHGNVQSAIGKHLTKDYKRIQRKAKDQIEDTSAMTLIRERKTKNVEVKGPDSGNLIKCPTKKAYGYQRVSNTVKGIMVKNADGVLGSSSVPIKSRYGIKTKKNKGLEDRVMDNAIKVPHSVKSEAFSKMKKE